MHDGHIDASKTYEFKSFSDPLVVLDTLDISRKLVRIYAIPTTAKIHVDNQIIETGYAELKLQDNKIITIKVTEPCYEDKTIRISTIKEDPIPSKRYDVVLENRIVKVKAPTGAEIWVNNRLMSNTGDATVIVEAEKSTVVKVVKECFVGAYKEYQNQPGFPQAPCEENFVLATDNVCELAPINDELSNKVIRYKFLESCDVKKAWNDVFSLMSDVFEIEGGNPSDKNVRTFWKKFTYVGSTIIVKMSAYPMEGSEGMKFKIESRIALFPNADLSKNGGVENFKETSRIPIEIIDAYQKIKAAIQPCVTN
jgi:hypothetical protein